MHPRSLHQEIGKSEIIPKPVGDLSRFPDFRIPSTALSMFSIRPLAVIAVGCGLFGCQKPKPSVPPPLPVTVAAARTGDVPLYLETFGTGVTIASVTVVPQVTGILAETKFTEGATVKKGDVIFQIDPRPYEAAVTQAQGNLETAEGRAAIEQFFATRYAAEIKGPPGILTSPGHSFSDVARKVVSIINLASLRAIENMVGQAVHPLRFRANIYVEGWPAWHEFDLLDRTLAIGDVRLKVVKRIVRCAAVNVDPYTAERDLAIPQALQRRLGHGDCGIYAEVTTGGSIAVGDAILAEEPELM